ncbi:hypothetical protein [Thalassomonas actiniarum]|uniref:Uncharacterized protein n=1 Tax=Thalassomonas actiniarum TaxID=485447 RepID=A0AAF0C3P9_9GAMM|nr:hypothetical protein [Thalassomonas actiniarum]WDD99203.1 hypothetical protein SG35_000490 [Thalassomonas actiniarum]
MDSKYIKDKNVIARYLRGGLTPEESMEFEEYLIDKPELIEQLEIDNQLMKVLPEVDYSKHESKTSLLDFLMTPLRASFATGVSCLLAVYLFTLYKGGIPAPPDGLVAKQSQVVFLDTFRGSANEQQVSRTIPLSAGTNSISIGIPAEPDYPTVKYKIQVSHKQIPRGQFSTKCRLADQSGYFFITLEGQPLQPGLYLIEAIPCHDKLTPKHLSITLTHQEST